MPNNKNQRTPRTKWLVLMAALVIGNIICFVSSGRYFVNLLHPLPATVLAIQYNNSDHSELKTTQLEGSPPPPSTVGSETSNSKIKKKLLESSWIKLFPHLSHMVARIDEGNMNVITNASKTMLSFESETLYEVGGVFKGLVTSYGDNGKRKTYGGDFYLATLRRPNSAIDGVSCDVTDNMDGSYDILCILPWEGKARIDVIMWHPSESIFELMKKYSSEEEFGASMTTTLLNSKNATEFTKCSIGFPSKSAQELCNFSNPSHGEKWTCIKPSSGECSRIIRQKIKIIRSQLQFFDDTFFRKNINHNVSINGSGKEIQVRKANVSNFRNYKNKALNMNPASPSGWFLESKWTSMKVNDAKDDLKNCVKNKRLYFFGDSTIRQWYTFFLKSLKLKDYAADSSAAPTQGRNAESETLNITLQYRAHGSPLHNPGPEECRPYISNSLDLIRQGGNGTIVFITIGYHFDLFDADVLGSRMRIIKTSINSLLKRLPGAKVLIKGLHNHGRSTLCPSSWLNFRYDVMLRHEFNTVANVELIELWDMTVLAKNSDLHPSGETLNTIMRLVLGYFC